MSKTSETGHAKNVVNFEELITTTISLDGKYNPSRPEIQIASLQVLSASARAALNGVNTTLPLLNNAVAAREVKFAPLAKLATRLLNAVKATSTTTAVDDNVKSLANKIRGVKATPKLTEEQKKALEAEGKSTREVSSSQMSYDSQLENFNKMIEQLASVPEYRPNEPELQVPTLRQLYDELKALNVAVVNAEKALDKARIVRNEVLYTELTGMVDIAADVKTYIKSVYGSSAPQYKQISKLAFSRVRS